MIGDIIPSKNNSRLILGYPHDSRFPRHLSARRIWTLNAPFHSIMCSQMNTSGWLYKSRKIRGWKLLLKINILNQTSVPPNTNRRLARRRQKILNWFAWRVLKSRQWNVTNNEWRQSRGRRKKSMAKGTCARGVFRKTWQVLAISRPKIHLPGLGSVIKKESWMGLMKERSRESWQYRYRFSSAALRTSEQTTVSVTYWGYILIKCAEAVESDWILCCAGFD